MKYIKLFETEADYEAGKSSLGKPYVAYVRDDDTLYYVGDNIVEIVDPIAKAVAIANFDTDGDGELSKQEALVVTDAAVLKSLFGYQSSINGTETDLSFLKYFKNAKFPAASNDYFRTCTYCTSFDFSGMDFGSVTSMARFFFYCRSVRYIGLKNLDLSNVTTFDSCFDFSPFNADLSVVIDFSGSTLPTGNVNFTSFVRVQRDLTFLMDGCSSASVEVIKNAVHNLAYVGYFKIIVDGKKWTCSSSGGTWVESDV